MSPARHLLLYDGVCGLCDRMNRFVLRRDRHDRFRFAALQSPTGRAWVERSGGDPEELSTFYVVAGYDGPAPQLLARGRAGLFVLRELGGAWRLAGMLAVLPDALLDLGYDVVAKRRYRWSGRYDVCLRPPAGAEDKFLDAGF